MVARVLCGPVIGLVTADSAIILLEVDREETVTMVLTSGQADTESALLLPAKQPRVFHFTGLKPDTYHKLSIRNVEISGDFQSGFFTLPIDPKKIKVAVVSCDFLERGSKVDMWQRLWHEAKDRSNPLNVVLHIGDNVYMDGDVSDKLSNREQVRHSAGIFDDKKINQSIAYVQARTLLQGLSDPSQWESKRDDILELYRDRYRQTWGSKYKAQILRCCSNLMILDDHEIRDDFGLLDEDGDPESSEYWLGSVALQVYHEYQRQLWDPDIVSTDKKRSLYNEFYSIRLGPLGIAMMDVRTPNSIYKQRRHRLDNSFYGKEQIDSFREILQGNDNTRMWLIGCALPLLFFKNKINKLLKDICKTQDDLEVFTSRGATDLQPIWEAVRTWKKSIRPSGDILLLSGDVHIGGFTDIFCPSEDDKTKPELLCHQVTTSPIRNKHWSKLQYGMGKFALEAFTDKFEDITYQHFDWVNSCNYALVNVDFSNPKVRYHVTLVPAKGTRKVKRSEDGVWYNPSRTSISSVFRSLMCVR